MRTLDLAEIVTDAPAAKDAPVTGRLSGRQAGLVARAEKADPCAGQKLADAAPTLSMGVLRTEADRITAAASTESPEQIARRPAPSGATSADTTSATTPTADLDTGSGVDGMARPAPIGADPVERAAVEDWSFARVVVIADLTALDRGHTGPGERCEVAGQGPVPVADVRNMGT